MIRGRGQPDDDVKAEPPGYPVTGDARTRSPRKLSRLRKPHIPLWIRQPEPRPKAKVLLQVIPQKSIRLVKPDDNDRRRRRI